MSETAILQTARDNLLAYSCLVNQSYKLPVHLVKVAKVLQKIERGELKRVIITIPPRHGKSMLCSQYFPAWFIGRNPDKYIITTSYGQDLSNDFGRKVRNQIKDPIFQKIFPGSDLTGDSQAVDKFETTRGGTYIASGINGSITGRGAHLFLVDDPIKNKEEADSETMRRKLEDSYSTVAHSRLMPGGAILVIMARWRQDDLVGHLLKEHAHENWTVINLKAIGDDGKALWPEAYPLEVLEKIRLSQRRNWHALYQQSPLPSEGRALKLESITGYDSLPEISMVLTACDPAISKDSNACNTAFCTIGVGANGHIYDLETIAGKYGFYETLDMASNILSRHHSSFLGVESNQYQAALVEACSRHFPLVSVVDIKAIKDKYLRAESVSHIIEKGLFHTNNRELLDEIGNFDPLATGDSKKDRVDALVHALHMAQKYAPFIDTKVDEREAYKHLNYNDQNFWIARDQRIKEAQELWD